MLDLRPMSVADADELFVIYRDTAMWAYDPARRHADPATTRSYCERAAARWDVDGLSYWTARLASSGEVIGSGGAQRHTTPGGSGGSCWNLNYRIATAHQGHGHATALLRAALAAAAERDDDLARIAWIDATNPASARVAARAGLRDHGARLGAADRVVRHAWTDRPLDDVRFPPAG
ncbi:hypothetical protein GCM10023340_24740 [Nocardioides marinquilinus]|uniref:N-acetyltransferase domain-containing protein n=1 Tax=Nocardioides marinquilinus TaxID=1210400 RepID=A0ABP9PRG3_9ACTN